MTIAKTGTDVTRTETGNSMLTMSIKGLFSFAALKVASISEEWLIWKLAAPVSPIIRYKTTQIKIG
jgi:hypothetical protein